MKRRPKVVVVGGGLAGLAASCELADGWLRPYGCREATIFGRSCLFVHG